MGATVNVSAEVLRWASSKAPAAVLPPNITSALPQWINGDKHPTYNQLETLSRKTGIPFGYFFLQKPPNEDLSLIEYRTVDSVKLEDPSRELVDTMHNMKMVQDWMHTCMQMQGSGPLKFVGSQTNVNSYSEFAENVRGILDIGKNWYEDSADIRDSFNILRKK